jgi:hypothetical protein
MGNKQDKKAVSTELTDKRSLFFNISLISFSIVLLLELASLKLNTKYSDKGKYTHNHLCVIASFVIV